ncbi:MAG: LTA synthase family protein [Clostridiaceae bacterium]|nr:LTA synthase family protein [Clostridiaceae bacterium]
MIFTMAGLIESPQKKNISGKNTAAWIINIGALIVWGLGIGVVSLYFASAAVNHWNEVFLSYFLSPVLLALNLIPPIIITFAFYLMTNRAWAAVAGSGFIVIGMSLVNFFKLTLRNDSLLVADLRLISEAVNMYAEYEINLSVAIVLTLAAFAAAIILSSRFLKCRIRLQRVRVGLLLLLSAFGGLLISGVYLDDNIYSSNENIGRNAWFMSCWSDRDQYVSRGFVYPFIYSAKNASEKPPEGYDKEESYEYLLSFENDDIPEEKKINIIAVMLEAYNDFSIFETIDFSNDPYEYFHTLQAEALTGKLVTNIFAGGTIDTERSFITGYTYMSEYRNETSTYASYLSEQGYTVEGGHPGYDWFYNRKNVNRYFGFDNYYFFEDRYEVESDALMHDSEFFDDILSLYESNKKSGQPYFNFSVTYQNHGPYEDDFLYDEDNLFVEKSGYSDEAYNILNNYFYGINLTDKSIKNLIETLRLDDEPVVVVFFGDHDPWLGDNSFVYEEADISLDSGTEDGFYNYYCTPYLIWANDSAKEVTGGEFEGDGGDFSPCFLMNRLFKECGYGGNAYMKASSQLLEYVDVVNLSGVFRTSDGVLTTSLEGEAAEQYSLLKKLEYYMKRDY